MYVSSFICCCQTGRSYNSDYFWPIHAFFYAKYIKWIALCLIFTVKLHPLHMSSPSLEFTHFAIEFKLHIDDTVCPSTICQVEFRACIPKIQGVITVPSVISPFCLSDCRPEPSCQPVCLCMCVIFRRLVAERVQQEHTQLHTACVFLTLLFLPKSTPDGDAVMCDPLW